MYAHKRDSGNIPEMLITLLISFNRLGDTSS